MPDFKSKTYQGKVLLFGEYTVMDGSAAIAIPFDKFGGQWAMNENDKESRAGLQKLKSYLAKEYYKGNIDGIDFDKFERDLTNGLVFNSTIPKGYGLGSSGALTAAFFDTYFGKADQYTLQELKATLSLIESCFHGNSSGLDPLVSLLRMPIMVHPDGNIEILEGERIALQQSLRLLDTSQARETAPLVNAYKLTKEKSPEFRKATEKLSTLTDNLITTYVLDQEEEYEKSFKLLSKAQLEILPMLIPQKYQQLWQKGIESDAYYMKLCGAGGGGYLLLYLKDIEKTQGILVDERLLAVIWQ